MAHPQEAEAAPYPRLSAVAGGRIAALEPSLVVCLSSTAAQALLGPSFRVTKQRGRLLDCGLAPRVMATVHPSSILRAPDEATRRNETKRFINDLRKAKKALTPDS